jgi:hypothetical protein
MIRYSFQLCPRIPTKRLHDFDGGDDIIFETKISEVAPPTVGSETTMLDGDNGSARRRV